MNDYATADWYTDISLVDDPHAYFDFLRAQGKQMVIVTNAHPKALSLKLAASGLDRHITHHISAHQFSLAKENTGFWARLQQHTGFDYSRSLFIDDNLSVLRCARAEGLRGRQWYCRRHNF